MIIDYSNIERCARRLGARYAKVIKDRRFMISFGISLVFLILSLAANLLSGYYATERASNAVSDIVLSNIPVFDVDGIFVTGPIIFWLIIILICLNDPKKIPFWLKSVALFVFIRSAFVSLTHIGPFPDHVLVDSFSLIKSINFYIFSSGADLFFSAHTGLPYLMALLFWDNAPVRMFCLASSIFFGIVVLLGHLHYSIDVISAYFITYTIYHIARDVFPEDLRRFLGEG
ncbi:MAG: hypothetical protein QOG91_56 [Candidatus Parcubacteria bacterium]|jgi:hypothetical protein|nr:hypothetical protein [Candidatus Parcubacteria bacterium]